MVGGPLLGGRGRNPPRSLAVSARSGRGCPRGARNFEAVPHAGTSEQSPPPPPDHLPPVPQRGCRSPCSVEQPSDAARGARCSSLRNRLWRRAAWFVAPQLAALGVGGVRPARTPRVASRISVQPLVDPLPWRSCARRWRSCLPAPMRSTLTCGRFAPRRPRRRSRWRVESACSRTTSSASPWMRAPPPAPAGWSSPPASLPCLAISRALFRVERQATCASQQGRWPSTTPAMLRRSHGELAGAGVRSSSSPER